MIIPSFKCPYCENEVKPTIDTTGVMPVGLLPLCDCPDARTAWETQHRAQMEQRKNAMRGGSVRSRSLVNVGRTGQSGGRPRHRSR